uniref:(northern house mosquito) hypothetical protein n=1 Tax=Culex pipiens TaxID=7175 RepID=A0A8D8H5Y3_CULPI
MQLMHRSFIEENIEPLQRIYYIWTVNFFVRAWRNWIGLNRKRGLTYDQYVTTNAYNCVELNAHALIAFIRDCRDRNVPEQCLVTFLSSQPCEKLFGQLRTMASTNQTVVNFTIKELRAKLKRLQMKTCIMHKYNGEINFPSLEKFNNAHPTQVLPNDIEITNEVSKAELTARQMLQSLGLSDGEIDFTDSLNLRSNNRPNQPTEFEFVNADSHNDEFSDLEEEEHDDDDPEIVGKSTQTQSSESADDEFDFSDTLEFVQVQQEFDERLEEPIYAIEDLFDTSEELTLKSTSAGDKHVFKIRDSTGHVKHIKKSTFLWMVAPGRQILSVDRNQRFRQK